MTKATSRTTLYVSLGGLAFFVLTFLFFAAVWGGSLQFDEMPMLARTFVVLGILGGFVFWFSMLADFFKNDAVKNRVLWGFALIFFWWIGSLAYLFKYVIPRYRND